MSDKVAPTLQGFLDKSTKYTKSWSKRFITLESSIRKLSYGESSQKAPKGFIFMTKVVRAAERNNALKPGNPDLYSFMVEGVKDDGKSEQWALRCVDEPSFCEWYFAIRESIASNGLMDPLNFGLPSADPRSNVPFATVPIEFLARFALLERAIIYCFIPAVFHSGEAHEPEQIFVAGDKFLYSFSHNADVLRCVPLQAVRKIYAGEMCMGLVVQNHPDMLIKRNNQVAKMADILKKTFLASTAKELEIDTSLQAVESIAAKLALTTPPDYKLDVHSPTPKLKLKHAMDMYEKQTGQKFVFGAAQAPAPQLPKGHEHTADAIDLSDPMAALLMRVKLTQYIVPLQRQHLDLDLLSCMEANDLVNFGISDPSHRQAIINAAKGEDVDQEDSEPDDIPVVRRPAIVLSDSDDDDLPMPNKKPIVLEDDDDDLLVMPQPNAKRVVLTDSDDDLPPVKRPIDGDDI